MTDKKKELIVKNKEASIQEYSEPESYGAADDITAKDITIGRIAVMQASSNLVKLDKAKQGAIVNLLDGKELGYKEERPLEFIPIKSFRYWIEKDADTKEYLGRTPASDADEKPWEEVVNGRNIQRMYHHSFYVLLPGEIDTMEEMPLELAFRSTDLAAARKLSSFLLKLRKRGEPSWNRIFKLTSQFKQKDKYSWFGTDVTLGEATKEEHRKISMEWYNQITKASDKIVHQAPEDVIVDDTIIPF